MAVSYVGDPVDAGVATDGVVVGINQDDLVVLVGGVLGNPVRVQDTEGRNETTDTLLQSIQKIRTLKFTTDITL